MECPACHSALSRRHYHRLYLEVCPSCRGIWFDPGNLNEFIEDLLDNNPDIPPLSLQPRDKTINLFTLREPVRTCPRCGQPLEKVNYGGDSNIVVDRCPACGGIWTDGGEIEKMATFVKGNPELTMLGHAMIEDQNEFREDLGRVQDVVINMIGLLSGLIPW